MHIKIDSVLEVIKRATLSVFRGGLKVFVDFSYLRVAVEDTP